MKRFPRQTLTRYFPDFELYIPDEDGVRNHHDNAKLTFGKPFKAYGTSDDPVKARPYIVFLDNLKAIFDINFPRELVMPVDDGNNARITKDGGLVIRRRYGTEEVRLSPWETRFLIKVMGRYC